MSDSGRKNTLVHIILQTWTQKLPYGNEKKQPIACVGKTCLDEKQRGKKGVFIMMWLSLSSACLNFVGLPDVLDLVPCFVLYMLADRNLSSTWLKPTELIFLVVLVLYWFSSLVLVKWVSGEQGYHLVLSCTYMREMVFCYVNCFVNVLLDINVQDTLLSYTVHSHVLMTVLACVIHANKKLILSQIGEISNTAISESINSLFWSSHLQQAYYLSVLHLLWGWTLLFLTFQPVKKH